MRKKALLAILYFFFLMAALTLIARAADGITLARVSVSRPGSGSLTHITQKEGFVEAADIVPVWAIEGLRVERVAFRPGDLVKSGDKLMYYDPDYVKDALAEKKLELKKLQAEQNCQTALEMEADMLVKGRQVDDAKHVLDKARGKKAKGEASDKLKRVTEDYDIASRQWNEKMSSEAKRQSALSDEIARVNERINDLEKLISNGCALICQNDSTVVSRNVEPGKLTGTDASFMLAKKDSPLMAGVSLTQDESKYVTAGDKAQALPSGQRDWLNVSVISVAGNEKGEYTAQVSISGSSLFVGQAIQIKFTKKTDSYRQCVPLSALHEDSAGNYVLIAVNERSVLGDTMTLKRVNAEVIDKDASRAAINAAVDQDESVVVKSDKAVDVGSRVRIDEV